MSNIIDKKDLYESVRKVILNARSNLLSQSNALLIKMYWHIGQLIVEDEQKGSSRAKYGKNVFKNLSKKLTLDFGKGFDERNLNNMRAFYQAFPKGDALRYELSWTHYRILSRVKDPDKRMQWMEMAIEGIWNTRTLQRNIESNYLGRMLENKPDKTEKSAAGAFIKDPYIFEFLGLPVDTRHTETSIESALISNLQQFLMELGKGFAFVARQQHIVTDTSDFFIDLVFYNYYLKCFVLIDLKTVKLKHEHIGQMDMYVRMYNDLKKPKATIPPLESSFVLIKKRPW